MNYPTYEQVNYLTAYQLACVLNLDPKEFKTKEEILEYLKEMNEQYSN